MLERQELTTDFPLTPYPIPLAKNYYGLTKFVVTK